MSSMIEQVKEAENRAEKVLQDAQQTARDLLNSAEATIKEEKSKLAEKQRIELRDAIKKAEEDGVKLTDDIVSKRKDEAEADCEKAKANIPEAVSYLLGKVVGGV